MDGYFSSRYISSSSGSTFDNCSISYSLFVYMRLTRFSSTGSSLIFSPLAASKKYALYQPNFWTFILTNWNLNCCTNHPACSKSAIPEIQNSQNPFNFNCKVIMSRCINEVDVVVVPSEVGGS